MSVLKNYQQCTISVMDNIADPDITFDEKGICNYYHEFKKAEKESVFKGEEGKKLLNEIVDKIKTAGKDKQYDCIMGLSGGVDSTYVALLAKQYGLRPLAVHFDNGWNSELAVMNIENIISKLGFDLYTLVVDWEEFKDIQLSYLKASVIDIEVATDHAISGAIGRLCKKHRIKYSLTGSNIVTEFVMPPSWIFNKGDHINLKAIHKAFGKRQLKTYPFYNTYIKKYLHNILKTEPVALLNYVPYNYKEIKNLITKEVGWKDYGGKHFESVFTKFYQAYILPTKFNVDKRKPHLSTLIFSGQVTKDEAIQELSKPLYNEQSFKKDYEFILKKLDLKHNEFQEIMHFPVRRHTDFATETSMYKRYPVLNIIKPLIMLIKRKD